MHARARQNLEECGQLARGTRSISSASTTAPRGAATAAAPLLGGMVPRRRKRAAAAFPRSAAGCLLPSAWSRAEKRQLTGRWSEKRDSPRAYQCWSTPSPRHRMRSHLHSKTEPIRRA